MSSLFIFYIILEVVIKVLYLYFTKSNFLMDHSICNEQLLFPLKSWQILKYISQYIFCKHKRLFFFKRKSEFKKINQNRKFNHLSLFFSL